MRHPVPRPRPRARSGALDRFLEEVLRSADTVELICRDLRRGAARARRRIPRAPGGDQPPRRSPDPADPSHRHCSSSTTRWPGATPRSWRSSPSDRRRSRATRAGMAAASARVSCRQPVASPGPARAPGARFPTPGHAARSFPISGPGATRASAGCYQFEFPPHVIYNDATRAGRRAQPGAPRQAHARDGRARDDGVDHGRADRSALGVPPRLFPPALGRGATRDDGHRRLRGARRRLDHASRSTSASRSGSTCTRRRWSGRPCSSPSSSR